MIKQGFAENVNIEKIFRLKTIYLQVTQHERELQQLPTAYVTPTSECISLMLLTRTLLRGKS